MRKLPNPWETAGPWEVMCLLCLQGFEQENRESPLHRSSSQCHLQRKVLIRRTYISSRNTRNIWTGLNSRKFVCKRITRLNVHLKLSTQEATGTFKIKVKTWVIMRDSVTLTTTKLYTLSEVWVIREKAVHVNLTCNRIFE